VKNLSSPARGVATPLDPDRRRAASIASQIRPKAGPPSISGRSTARSSF
jgi:hypothetical protein